MQKKYLPNSYKGFSLVEMLVAMFIFSLVIGIVSQIFTQAFVGYREQKRLQSNIESAQFAINTIAKELRTASVVSAGGGNLSSIEFFDYSQSTCFLYSFSGNQLTEQKKSENSVSDCDGLYGGATTVLIDGINVDGHFNITKSVLNTTIGRVTIFISLGETDKPQTRLQTSVSLRDYEVSGVQ